jgi:RNA polymerase sigma-70 factor (ECF subfamily)
MNHREKDSELLKRTCQGDSGAFAALVLRYYKQLVAFLIRMGHPAEMAEDLAQEAFYQLYLKASRYRELESSDGVIPLLARIAMNAGSNARKHDRRTNDMAVLLKADSDIDPSRPDLEAEAKEAAARVREALAKLPKVYGLPLTLYEIEDWTYQQIARHIDISMGTVKSRINRGRALVRKMLSGYWQRRQS